MTYVKHNERTSSKRTALVSFVKQVLKKRFPNVEPKQSVDESRGDKISFACPFCGDSQKKYDKKRGNMWFNTGKYKCFNDGCMTYMSVKEFVSKLSKKFSVSVPNVDLGNEKDASEKTHRNLLVAFMMRDRSNLVTVDEFVEAASLVLVSDMSEDSNARKYCEKRMLQECDFEVYTDKSDSRLYFINADSRSRHLLGYAIRSLDPNASRKYIVQYCRDYLPRFPNSKLSDETIEEIDFVNNYFNVMNVNFAQKMTVTEGQIDSMFVNNCFASTGVSKIAHILAFLGTKPRILFDRDRGGKTEMLKLISKGFEVFLWNKLVQDLMGRFRDKVDLAHIKEGVKDINDLYVFLRRKSAVSDRSDFNTYINQFWSNNTLDVAYI